MEYGSTEPSENLSVRWSVG